jgi:hypothetical protein
LNPPQCLEEEASVDRKHRPNEQDPLPVNRERRIEDTARLEVHENHPAQTRERLL